MQIFDSRYNQINKAEIHCHLEGSIRTQTLIEIAREHGLSLPADEVDALNPHVKVYEQLKDLQSVLDAFRIAQNSIASPATVERIAYELFEDANRQNVRLFELRFSPDWAFSGHNLDWDEALQGILRGKERAEAQFEMAIGLIAITSRGLGVESCEKTVDWALRWKEHIQGIDLADGEAQHPIGEFVRPVLRAKEGGLKVTVHSGEDTPASAVVETIRQVHPERIGHGIHIIEDMDAVEVVKREGVTLEVNPWSNYLTNSVQRIEEHPLKRLFDLGVKVTINSDDPELLDTNLNNEYRIAHEILGMSLADIAACNRAAVEASFLPEVTKRAVQEKYFSNTPEFTEF
jgi:adenosine deaminase